MTAERIIALLGLERGTCGYMGLTYRSPLAVAPDAAGGGGEWALLGTTSWPGVADGEFEPGDAAVIQRRHPEFAGQLAAFA